GQVFVNAYFDTAIDQVLGSTQFDPTGKAPTNLTVVGSRAQFPGLLANALDNVIAHGQRLGLMATPRSARGPVSRYPTGKGRDRRVLDPPPSRHVRPSSSGPDIAAP
ncbi:MAG: hypothetical protein K0S43_2537, partial [Cellulosimicrobium sp.]|nr:hypothetical protein [Cellulosimicrobium sp.]